MRAASQRLSMQEYLRGELIRIASRPSLEAWLETVQSRKEAAGTVVSATELLDARNADRR